MIFELNEGLDRARLDLDRSRDAEAAARLEAWLEGAGVDIDALAALAAARLRLGEPEASIAAQHRLAEALVARGELLRAAFVYRRVWEMVQAQAPGLAERYADVHARLVELRRSVDARRDTLNAYAEAAAALERNGRDADAIEIFDKLVSMDTSNPVFQVRRAEALCRLDRLDEAIEAFRAAAALLVGFERPRDASKVLERILHLRPDPSDARAAARLYLERGTRNDAIKALAQLQICVQADPEDQRTLALLTRAFETMGQEERALEVRKEMVRLASEAGDGALCRELATELGEAAPEAAQDLVPSDSQGPRPQLDTPRVSIREAMASIPEEELRPTDPMNERPGSASDSVLEQLSFREVSVLSEVWVMPVLSKVASRALDEADAFIRLRLYDKAEYALRAAVEQEPTSAELREKLRTVLRLSRDARALRDESLALAALYLQRRYERRAAEILRDLLEQSPHDAEARALLGQVEAPTRAQLQL